MDFYSLNLCILAGVVGEDPEIFVSDDGDWKKRATFPLGTREINRNKKIRGDWTSVIAWSNLATFCQKYVKKNSSVIVVGRIIKDVWKTDAGRTMSNIQLRAERIIFFGKLRDSDEETEPDEPDESPY